MKKALVTAIGSFASDIVIKTLKEEGFYVIGCDIYPEKWVAQSLETDEFYRAPLAAEEEKYIGFLKEICREQEVELLLPLTDVEVDVLNNYRDDFQKDGLHTTLCFSGKETIALCRDKLKLEAYVREKGICNTIPSMDLREVFEKALELSKDISEIIQWEEVVLKPFNGRSSSGLYRVHDKEKLPFYLGLIDNGDGYIVQPFIDGVIITVDVVRDRDGNVVAVPRKEHLRTLNGAGTSVEVFRDKELEETCGKLAEVLDIKGCVNFEFIEEDSTGDRYFMECNPRFAGGAAFSCEAGCNVAKRHIQVFRDGVMEKKNLAVHSYIARKYSEYKMEL